jgi:hypothetical protein
VYDNIIYRYKYVTDSVEVSIKFLHTKTKESNNSHTENSGEHNRLSIRTVPTQVTTHFPSSFTRKLTSGERPLTGVHSYSKEAGEKQFRPKLVVSRNIRILYTMTNQ